MGFIYSQSLCTVNIARSIYALFDCIKKINIQLPYSVFQRLTNLPESLEEKWNGKFHEYMRAFYNLPKELTRQEKMLFLNDSLKITFVRHPFVRLVSTYQDKIIDHKYKKWRKEMSKLSSNSKVRL